MRSCIEFMVMHMFYTNRHSFVGHDLPINTKNTIMYTYQDILYSVKLKSLKVYKKTFKIPENVIIQLNELKHNALRNNVNQNELNDNKNNYI